MFSLRTSLVRGGLVAALAIGAFVATGTATAAAAGQEPAKAPISVGAPHAAYAGSDTCLTCHQEYGAALTKGAHSHAFRAGTPMSPKGCQACHADTKATMGCEGCHGPGKAHADAGGDKTKILRLGAVSPKDASAICVELPLPDAARALGGQPARPAQRRLHHLPQHPQGRGREAAQGRQRDRAVRAAATARSSTSSSSSTHMPVREGKLVVLLVPQRARHARTSSC